MQKSTFEEEINLSSFYAEIAEKIDQRDIAEMLDMFEVTRIEVKAQLRETGNIITCLVDALNNQMALSIFENTAKLLNVSYKILSFEKVIIHV